MIISNILGIYEQPHELPKGLRLRILGNSCLQENFFAPNSLQNPSNPISLIHLVTMRPLTQYQPKIITTKLQKSAKFYLTLFPIFSLRFKFSFKRPSGLIHEVFQKNEGNSSQNVTIYNNWSSNLVQDVFQKDYINSRQTMTITIGTVNKDIKSKIIFCTQLWT